MADEGAIREAFAIQQKACAALGSPFAARLAGLVGSRLKADNEVGVRILGWRGDPSPSADSVPLRFAGALHALVLTGTDRQLASVYPPHHETVSDEALWSAIDTACQAHARFLLDWLKSSPQTNEVRRSSGIFAGLQEIARQTGTGRIALLELGASAGLNLICDRLRYEPVPGTVWGDAASPLVLTPQWRGPLPDAARFAIAARAGCDLNPLDIRSASDVLRLRSYTWPDQTDRLERLDLALKLALAALPAGAVAKSDAADWLEMKLAQLEPGAATVIYHTIAWQYFPKATMARCEAAIGKAAALATRQTPLAWLAIEADGGSGAAIRLRVWPQATDRVLGRMDFHGRWVEWNG